MRLYKWMVGAAAFVILSLVVVPIALAVEVDLQARLSGSSAYPRVTGHSEYERGSGGREVEVTIRNAGRLAGRRLSVFVAGQKIGTMLVSGTGTAHIERDTERGQFVPVASVGSTVRVRTGGGTLVAGGRYVREVGD